MHRLKKTGESILWGGLIFLLFLVFFENKLHIPNWLMVVGRMHPLFLHFPIVLLLLSFFTAWLPANEQTGPLLTSVRLIACLSAIITAIMGLLLSRENAAGGYTLQWHKWGGVIIAVSAFLFYRFYSFLTINKITARLFTIAAGIVITLTGHFGANLTHGNNYLLAPVQRNEKRIMPIEQAFVFTDIIKPVFDNKCGSCHAEGTIKGGLSLEDTTGIVKGGKTGPLYVAGEPAVSLLLKRIHLPSEDKKHMPPRSKAQLTDDEMALLSAWIKSGAPLNSKLTTLPVKDSFRMLAAVALAPAGNSVNQKGYAFAAADEKKIKALNNNYRVLEPQGIGSPALAVYFYGKNAYSKKSLEELLQVKQQVVSLSLARMPVKDDEMAIVSQLSNLENLNLNYTDISSRGVEQLVTLRKLQEVSLSGTGITANAIEKIASLPEMNSVFVWNTKIDAADLAGLQNKFRKLHIETGFKDDGKFVVELSPPVIQTAGGVFDNATSIKIKHPFRGVDIRYTLDGSVPDSANSPFYKDSIRIQTNTKLTARAFKKGWSGSVAVQAAYIKRGYKPDSVELLSPPDIKYKAPARVLYDGELGDQNFGSGQWLGYQNNESSFYLFFNHQIEIHNILVNLLKSTEQSIFLPVTMQVWVGMDKTHLKLAGQINSPVPPKNEPGLLVQQTVSFKPVLVKCIKIVAQPVKMIPQWHASKGKRGWVFLNEVVVN
jgi:uncharacterized membrane protein